MQFKDLLKALETSSVEVSFIRADSDIRRVMECTRNRELIEADIGELSPNISLDLPDDQIGGRVLVWDREKKGWRSFIFENVYDVVV